MELDARKLQILKAVIDEYITSAAPVGSRSISKQEGFHLSSATIRNEMADLEELGYLQQPHTSAGRIPSDKAYRLYVDRIMHRAQLSAREIAEIRAHMDTRLDGLESMMRQMAQVLSTVTNYTAVAIPPAMVRARLRHIQLIPFSVGRALAVIVTDTGYTRDTVLRIPDDMGYEELERLSRLITDRLQGCRLDEAAERMSGVIGAELYHRRDFLQSMMTAIERRVSPEVGSVELSGATNMLHYPEYADMDKVRTFLAAVEGRDTLYRMLRRASRMEFTITIGSENESEELRDCSVVTATYRVDDEPMGTFGIIGPTRMQYGKVLSVLEYMQKSFQEMLTNQLEEDQH